MRGVDLTSHAFMVSADAGDVHGATVGGRGVLFDRGSVNVVTGGDEQRPPRPGIVEPHPTAALSLNADAVAVICAPRGELVARRPPVTTKTAPPLGAVLLRTVVVPAMARPVRRRFGPSAERRRRHNADSSNRSLSIPSIRVSVNVAPHALVRYRAAAETRRDVLSNDDAEPAISPAAARRRRTRDRHRSRRVCRDFATVQRQRRTCG